MPAVHLRSAFMICFTLIIMMGKATVIRSEEIEVRPEIALEETYSDNVNLTANQCVHDFITRIIPGFSIRKDTETYDLKLRMAANIDRYVSEDDLNHDDERVNLDWTYRPQRLIRLDLQGMWAKESALEVDLLENGLLYTHNDQETLRFKPSMEWRAAEIYRLRLATTYEQKSYDDPDYYDYYFSDTIIGFGRAVGSERLLVFVDGEYGYASAKQGRDTTYSGPGVSTPFSYREQGTLQNYGVMAGFDYTFDPQWTLVVRYGITKSHLEYDPFLYVTLPEPGVVYDEDFRTNFGYFTLKRTFELGSASLELRRDIIPTASDPTVDRFTVKAGLDYSITERFSGSLDASYASSQSLSDHGTTDSQAYMAAAACNYRMGEQTDLILTIRHDGIRNKESGEDIQRNSVSLQWKTYGIYLW